MRVVLGSHSPRRKEILSFFKIPFLQAASHFNEDEVVFDKDPIPYCTTLALKKAETLSVIFPDDLIITADTIVFCKGEVLNKPKNRKDAVRMLSMLSGNKHTVYSGVCVYKKGSYKTTYDSTEVEFNTLSPKEIDIFLDNESYLERSGSYTIQGRGSLLIKTMHGCYYNVLGLPVRKLHELLKEFDIDLWNYV